MRTIDREIGILRHAFVDAEAEVPRSPARIVLVGEVRDETTIHMDTSTRGPRERPVLRLPPNGHMKLPRLRDDLVFAGSDGGDDGGGVLGVVEAGD